MSYDLYLDAPESSRCPTCGHTPEHEVVDDGWNYTSNMAGAWAAAGAPLRDMDGWTGERAADAIEAAIAKIEAEGRAIWAAKWNSPNGWGKIDSMIDNFLAPFAQACREYRTYIVRVSR